MVGKDAITPTLSFTTLGFYEKASGELRLAISGVSHWTWTAALFQANLTNGGALVYETPTSTNPAWTFQGDNNTGVGWAGNGKLSLISDGKEMWRLDFGALINYSYAVIDATAVGHETSAEWKEAYDSFPISGTWNPATDSIDFVSNTGAVNNFSVLLTAISDPDLQDVVANDGNLTLPILSTAGSNTFGSTTFDGAVKLNDNKNLTWGTDSDITADWVSGTNEFVFNTAITNSKSDNKS